MFRRHIMLEKEQSAVDIKANREYKDSVFRLLFGKPEILRNLYSAIDGVDLPPETVVPTLNLHF